MRRRARRERDQIGLERGARPRVRHGRADEPFDRAGIADGPHVDRRLTRLAREQLNGLERHVLEPELGEAPGRSVGRGAVAGRTGSARAEAEDGFDVSHHRLGGWHRAPVHHATILPLPSRRHGELAPRHAIGDH
jgi:hypothetical protein